VDPVALGFIPSDRWSAGEVLLETIMTKFFRARSTRLLRFEHKLWNALVLTRSDSALYPFIGVIWLTRRIIKVNCDVFWHFINVTRPASALCSMQGSFATHGFQEISLRHVAGMMTADQISDVDESTVRLFVHTAALFTACATNDQVLCCKYGMKV
jgi:hypothetical protein